MPARTASVRGECASAPVDPDKPQTVRIASSLFLGEMLGGQQHEPRHLGCKFLDTGTYAALVESLESVPPRYVDRARTMLKGPIGEVRLIPEGEYLTAEFELEGWRLLAAADAKIGGIWGVSWISSDRESASPAPAAPESSAWLASAGRSQRVVRRSLPSTRASRPD